MLLDISINLEYRMQPQGVPVPQNWGPILALMAGTSGYKTSSVCNFVYFQFEEVYTPNTALSSRHLCALFVPRYITERCLEPNMSMNTMLSRIYPWTLSLNRIYHSTPS